MTKQKLQEAFSSVYQNNVWDNGETRSGNGSSMDQTKYIRQELPFLITNLHIRSILDIPCGEFYWIKEIITDDIKYHGADIVPEIIEHNNQFKTDNISFSILDILSDALPYADLMIVRDCFVHLPNELILKGLANIKASGCKYLLTTHFNWLHLPNSNLPLEVNGSWRRINFCLPPFKLRPPLYSIVEGCPEPVGVDKTLALWRVEDL